MLVGRELVKQTHLYTGEEVRVVSPLSDPSNPDATGTPIPFNRDYRVAGIFYTGMYEYDLKYVYVTLESLQDFLDRGDAIDGIEVRISDADDTERYIPTSAGPGLIRQALGPGYRVDDWRELNRSLFSALKLEKIAMFLVLGIVILVASFSIVGNLIMVVVEKAREIALLKTLGASNFGRDAAVRDPGPDDRPDRHGARRRHRPARLLGRQAVRTPAQPGRLLHRPAADPRRSRSRSPRPPRPAC